MTFPDQRLLSFLSAELGTDNLEFLEPPTTLSGGYDTSSYRFELTGASYPGVKVIRAFPHGSAPERAIREGAIQDAVARQGYPVPPAELCCTDSGVIGSPFIVMPFVEGKLLLDIDEPASSQIMGRLHARLHELDTAEIANELVKQSVADVSLDELLHKIELSSSELTWMQPLTDWLKAYRPDETARSVCHGDFHKLNVVVADDGSPNVLDWSNFRIMDPAFDVANTIISFTIMATRLAENGDFEPVDTNAIVDEYLGAYSGVRRLDTSNLDYYKCLRAAMMLLMAAMNISPFNVVGVEADLRQLVSKTTSLDL